MMRRRSQLYVRLLFAGTMTLSAALLFLIQFLTARLLLPALGGSPAVWTTVMVLFQILLLGGYLYAHLCSRWATAPIWAAVHIAMFVLASLLSSEWRVVGFGSDPTETPIASIILTLSMSVAAPFVLLATTAPVMQVWYSHIGQSDSSDPYFLYASSNVGSAVAVLTYPAIIEPSLSLSAQLRWWWVGFAAVGLLICASAVLSCFLARGRARVKEKTQEISQLGILLRARWLLLAFIPSALLVAVTNHIGRDVAAIPLIWIPPLALYLLTFVIAFNKSSDKLRPAAGALLPIALIAVAYDLLLPRPDVHGLGLRLFVHLSSLFVVSLYAHLQLARLRPPSGFLTSFYLYISAGGAAGGLSVSLLAPVVFLANIDYPAIIVFAALLRVGFPPKMKGISITFLTAAAVALCYVALKTYVDEWTALLVCSLVVLSSESRKLRFSVCLAALFLSVGLLDPARTVLTRARNFFGTLEVVDIGGELRVLAQGNTWHGAQSLRPEQRNEPTMNFARNTPVASALRGRGTARRIAVVGLGLGQVVRYVGASDSVKFFEINKAVADIAENPRLFTLLSTSVAPYTVEIGDGRLKIAKEPPLAFDLIVLDAFNTLAIPVHLLTAEAFSIYSSVLKSQGYVVINAYNLFADLGPAIRETAAQHGFVGWRAYSADRPADGDWIVLARSAADVENILADTRWVPLEGKNPSKPWSDDYADVLSTLSFTQRRH